MFSALNVAARGLGVGNVTEEATLAAAASIAEKGKEGMRSQSQSEVGFVCDGAEEASEASRRGLPRRGEPCCGVL